jgi:hypothetical protein
LYYYVSRKVKYLTKGGDSVTIASDLIRGNTDTIILASLMKKDSYGSHSTAFTMRASGILSFVSSFT